MSPSVFPNDLHRVLCESDLFSDTPGEEPPGLSLQVIPGSGMGHGPARKLIAIWLLPAVRRDPRPVSRCRIVTKPYVHRMPSLQPELHKRRRQTAWKKKLIFALFSIPILLVLACSATIQQGAVGVAAPYEPRSFDEVSPENVDLQLVSAPNLPQFPDCGGRTQKRTCNPGNARV